MTLGYYEHLPSDAIIGSLKAMTFADSQMLPTPGNQDANQDDVIPCHKEDQDDVIDEDQTQDDVIDEVEIPPFF